MSWISYDIQHEQSLCKPKLGKGNVGTSFASVVAVVSQIPFPTYFLELLIVTSASFIF